MDSQMEDSRASTVGRKRDLEDVNSQDHPAGRSVSPDENAPPKKRSRGASQIADSTGSVPVFKNDSSHRATLSSRTGKWNRGVQSSLRTSFGNKLQTKLKLDKSPHLAANGTSAVSSDPTTAPELDEYVHSNRTEDDPPSTSLPNDVEYEPPKHADGEMTVLAGFQPVNSHNFEADDLRETTELSTSLAESANTSKIVMSATTDELKEPPSPDFRDKDILSSPGMSVVEKCLDVPQSVDANLGSSRASEVGLATTSGGVAAASSDTFQVKTEDTGSYTPTQDDDGVDSTPFHVLSTKEVSALSKNERAKYKKSLKQHEDAANAKETEKRTRAAEAIFAHQTIPLLKDYEALQDEIASGLTYFPRVVPKALQTYQKSKINFRLPEILKDGKPIRIQNLDLATFTLGFFNENETLRQHLTEAKIAAAYNAYITLYYSHCMKWRDDVFKLAPNGKVSASVEQQKPDSETAGEKANEPANELVEINLNQDTIDSLERELQLKYFPPTINQCTKYHCLACGDTYHLTLNCPTLSCKSCGGPHAQSACQQLQRCTKCHERGHSNASCPEKLGRGSSETVPCDLCGSHSHIETSCNRIWRTFLPEEKCILKVRAIPVHCYNCGASGHYGTECGLAVPSRVLSGGYTFSKANLSRFVDGNSSHLALSGGSDYSIPPTTAKMAGSKGKAKKVIEIGHSSDDDALLLTRRARKPKSHGKIEVVVSNHNPTARDDNHSRPIENRDSRDFGNIRAGRGREPRNFPPHIDSARYDHDRESNPRRSHFPSSENSYRPRYQLRSSPPAAQWSSGPTGFSDDAHWESTNAGQKPFRTSVEERRKPRGRGRGR